jgi:hypothetical protein
MVGEAITSVFKKLFIILLMSAYTTFLTVFTFAACLGITLLMWCGWVMLLAHFSKWKKLELAYPPNLDQTLATKKRVYAKIGFGNYNGMIVLESTLQSLRMRTIFMFKMGFKPISIPWADLTYTKKNVSPLIEWMAFNYIFVAAKQPDIIIYFNKKSGGVDFGTASEKWIQ